jgi:hypothetical protein
MFHDELIDARAKSSRAPTCGIAKSTQTAESPGHRSREAYLADYSAFAALKHEWI